MLSLIIIGPVVLEEKVFKVIHSLNLLYQGFADLKMSAGFFSLNVVLLALLFLFKYANTLPLDINRYYLKCLKS